MKRGDHIRAWRGTYWHHGIACGDGVVIHYSGELKDRKNAVIQRTTLETFARGHEVEVVPYVMSSPPDRVVERAESRLGERRYGIFHNNCEHFARWCKTGESVSGQVQRVVRAGVGVAGVAVSTAAVLVLQRRLRRG